MDRPTLCFTPGAQTENAAAVCRFFGLQVSSDVARIMSSFTVTADGVETTVKVGEQQRYVVALLILYLHRLSGVGEGEAFPLTEDMCKLLELYAGPKVFADARENDQTGHIVVRAILGKEKVLIKPVFDRRHEGNTPHTWKT